MITQLRVSGFKSLQNFELNFNKGINMLVGPNGTGKTNICQSLGLIASVVDGGVNQYLLSLGGINATFCNSKTNKECVVEPTINIGIDGSTKIAVEDRTLELRFKYDVEIFLDDNREIVLNENFKLYRLSKHKNFVITLDVISNNREIEIWVKKPDLIGPSIKLIKKRRKIKIPIESSWGSALDLLSNLYYFCHNIKEELRKLKLYNIDPHIAKRPSDILEPSDMLSNGKRLPNAIFDLFKEKDAEDSIQNFMSMIFPEFQKLSTESSDEGLTRSFSITDVNGFSCSAPGISDGTIKIIALLVGIHSQQHSSVIIEEPENYLHPWACQSLIEYLRDNFSEGICILTSHSETILNATKPSEIVVCEKKHDFTECSRICNEKKLEEIISSSGMGCGYHYVSGSIGGVPI